MEELKYHVIGHAPPLPMKSYATISKEVYDLCIDGLKDFLEVRHLRAKLEQAIKACKMFTEEVSIVKTRYAASNPRFPDKSGQAELIESFDQALASVIKYVDHATFCFSHRFDDKGAEFLSFKNMLSKEFDSNFSYRLVTKLRSYALHCDTALNACTGHSHLNNNGSIAIELRVNIDAETLLAKSNKWGRILKRDLILLVQDGKSQMDAVAILDGLIPSLQNIQRGSEDIFMPFLQQAGRIITETSREALQDGRFPNFTTMPEVLPSRFTMTLHHVPIKMLEELGFLSMEKHQVGGDFYDINSLGFTIPAI